MGSRSNSFIAALAMRSSKMSLLIYLIILMDVLNAVVVTDDAQINEWKTMRQNLISGVPTIKVSGDNKWSVALKSLPGTKTSRLIDSEMCDGYFGNPGVFICENCFNGATTHVCNFIILPDNNNRIMLAIKIDQPDPFGSIHVYDGVKNTNKLDKVLNAAGTYYFLSTGRSMLIRIRVSRLKNIPHQWTLFYDTKPENLLPTKDTKGCVEQLEAPGTFRLPSQQFGSLMSTQCVWYVTNPNKQVKSMTVVLPQCIPGDEENCVLRFITIYSGHGIHKQRLTRYNDTTRTLFKVKSQTLVIEYAGCLTATPLDISISTGTQLEESGLIK